MYGFGAILTKQPVAIAGALRSIVYVLVLAGIISWSPQVIAGLALALELVLGLFVWNSVTPTADPELKPGTTVTVNDPATDAPPMSVTLPDAA